VGRARHDHNPGHADDLGDSDGEGEGVGDAAGLSSGEEGETR
jgi:hypothetical protein